MPPDSGQKSSLTRHRLLQLAVDEAVRDGRIDESEKGLLQRLTAALRLEETAPAEAVARARERLKAGKLGAPRPLDPRKLYFKAAGLALRDDPPSAKSLRLLELLAGVLELSREESDALAARAKDSLRSPAESHAPVEALPAQSAENAVEEVAAPEPEPPKERPIEPLPVAAAVPEPVPQAPASPRREPGHRLRARASQAEIKAENPDGGEELSELEQVRQIADLLQKGRLGETRRRSTELLVRIQNPGLRDTLTKIKRAATPPGREIRPSGMATIGLVVMAILAGLSTMTPVVRLNPIQGAVLVVALLIAAVGAAASKTAMDTDGITVHRLLSRRLIEWQEILGAQVEGSRVLVNGVHTANEIAVVLKLRDGKEFRFTGSDGVNADPRYHDFAVTLVGFLEQRVFIANLFREQRP